MSRYIQDVPKGKEPKPTKPTKPSPGSYTSDNLDKAKKIPTQGGFR